MLYTAGINHHYIIHKAPEEMELIESKSIYFLSPQTE